MTKKLPWGGLQIAKNPTDNGDDIDFKQAMDGTMPLDKNRVTPSKPPLQVTTPRPDFAPNDSVAVVDQVTADSDLYYVADGVGCDTLRYLDNADFCGVDAKIDLHGDKIHQAEYKLGNFLQRSASNNHRLVCVVHGKGKHSLDGVPVLKNAINQWLRQHRSVLAFKSATPRWGGTGAVIVLLDCP